MKKIYLNPLPVRIWHWVNALSFLILIFTGLQIRYTDVMSVLSFAAAVDLHNVFGFVLLFNYLLWLGYYLLSGKLFKIYVPALNLKKFIEGSIRQAKYYGYGLFIGEQNPHHASPDSKFNPLQQVAYLNIMALFIPLQILTGLMMWDIAGFSSFVSFMGGIKIVDGVHVLLFLFFSSFLFVHLYLASLGHTVTTHLKAMIYGYEELPEGDHHH